MTVPRHRPSHRLARPLAGAALVATATLSLPAIGVLVARQPFAMDRAVLAAVRDAGPLAIRRLAVDVTALGGGPVLTLLVLAAAALLLVRRRPFDAAALVLICWSGGRVVQLVKDIVMRARPDIADRLVPVGSASFPSAHAANATIVYLTLAALAAQASHDRATRQTLFAVAASLVGAIGASRVYLGVHWPSDVAAGWSFGTAWALGWWWITARARGSVRQPRH